MYHHLFQVHSTLDLDSLPAAHALGPGSDFVSRSWGLFHLDTQWRPSSTN